MFIHLLGIIFGPNWGAGGNGGQHSLLYKADLCFTAREYEHRKKKIKNLNPDCCSKNTF